MTQPAIFLALRFHLNYYHSYRGDSLDERGIGKDIRIITSIIRDLDKLNSEGLAVRGTWDIENYYSLEQMMPRHSPELITAIQRRVAAGRDEIEPMSYNNGLVSACTPEEFDLQMQLLRSNAQGSGLDDLFPTWQPVLRPQECMYTPSFLARYPQHGISTISLYNSAVPFNAFSTFIPPLDTLSRYNPLTLTSSANDAQMTVLPAYNHGDIADNFVSLRRWLTQMRKTQLAMDSPQDLLLCIDMDADDEFWAGEDIPLVPTLFPSFGGLYKLIRSVADLSYLHFATPGDYLQNHPPVGSICINQDTADGSFDGLSSWAEKWENTKLWTRIHHSRCLEQGIRWFAGQLEESPAELTGPGGETLEEAIRQRLLAMSTTHFGMASPVMNRDRLKDGYARADEAQRIAAGLYGGLKTRWMEACGKDGVPACDADLLLTGISGQPAAFNAVVKLPDRDYAWTAVEATSDLSVASGRILQRFSPSVGTEYATVAPSAFKESEQGLQFSDFKLNFPAAKYAGKLCRARVLHRRHLAIDPAGRLQGWEYQGVLVLPEHAGEPGSWTLRIFQSSLQPGVFIDVEYQLPETEHRGYKKAKARRLNATWDHRWQEFRPAEIVPRFQADLQSGMRIFKRNFFGDESFYDIDYARFSRNHNIDSMNNHITNGWVGAGNHQRGLIIAQSGALDTNFAFCPMRTRKVAHKRQQLYLNPFGTYYGRQWSYPTAKTGIGRRMALLMADQLDSYAPSFNGKAGGFSLYIQSFNADSPGQEAKLRATAYGAGVLEL